MKLRKFLFPFSLLYDLITRVRNFFYDKGFLKSEQFDVPVICVGNLNTGGTGKTPHVEYIIQLLKNNFVVATLSRGYGRITKGFFLVKPEMNVEIIGDEPYQYFLKFPDIIVAVGEDRTEAIEKLISKNPGIDAIILDDAFQHRAVKAGLNILLTDYSDLFINDQLLPSGNLRESKSGYKRSDLIVITKCPEKLTGEDKKKLVNEINPLPHQQVLFSYFNYEPLIPLFNGKSAIETSLLKEFEILLITGIAKAHAILDFLKKKSIKVHHLKFSDHYHYTPDDLKGVQRKFDNIVAQKKIIVTTEKDFMRLQKEDLKKLIHHLPLYFLPVKVMFDQEDKNIFDEKILNYVGKN